MYNLNCIAATHSYSAAAEVSEDSELCAKYRVDEQSYLQMAEIMEKQYNEQQKRRKY